MDTPPSPPGSSPPPVPTSPPRSPGASAPCQAPDGGAPSPRITCLDDVRDQQSTRIHEGPAPTARRQLMGAPHVYRAEDPRARVLRCTARNSTRRATTPPWPSSRPRSPSCGAPPRPAVRDQRESGRCPLDFAEVPAAMFACDAQLRPHRGLRRAHQEQKNTGRLVASSATSVPTAQARRGRGLEDRRDRRRPTQVAPAIEPRMTLATVGLLPGRRAPGCSR